MLLQLPLRMETVSGRVVWQKALRMRVLSTLSAHVTMAIYFPNPRTHCELQAHNLYRV